MHLEILCGKAPGHFFGRFVRFGARAALAVDDLCHKRFGDDCLGGLFGDGVADIWIGLKTDYHQNCFSMWTHIIPILFIPFFLISINPFGLWVVYLETAIINIKAAKKKLRVSKHFGR